MSDPERLIAGITGADLAACQLSARPATSELARVLLPGTCLDMVRLGPAMLFSGAMPDDCYTLMFVIACQRPGHSFNFEREHTDGYLAFWPPGGALDATTPAGYANATLTLPVAAFEAAVAIHFPDIPPEWLTRGAALHLPPAGQAPLRHLLDTLRAGIWNPEQPLANPRMRLHAERNLIAAFFTAMRAGREHLISPAPPRQLKRHRSLRQARDYLSAHVHETVYLHDLCRSTGLTVRTLENLFRDLLGITPTAFLRHQRLHGVRRDFQQMAPVPGLVKQVAHEWGFLHQGHFARDYQALFGESPSATLTR